jgi:hypothetical protein
MDGIIVNPSSDRYPPKINDAFADFVGTPHVEHCIKCARLTGNSRTHQARGVSMKSNFVVLHDNRLKGVMPPRRPHLRVINVGEHISLHLVFGHIKATKHIHTIFILCHGYAGEDPKGARCLDRGEGGLELGKEEVIHSNVAMWRTIVNSAENIVVYACGAGDTQPGYEGTDFDGRYLMGALAIHTNSTVFAADRVQFYLPNNGGHIDFGDWEGTLWRFPPNGAAPSAVPRAPVELNDIVS